MFGFLILGGMATLYFLLAREAEGLLAGLWVCGVCGVVFVGVSECCEA